MVNVHSNLYKIYKINSFDFKMNPACAQKVADCMMHSPMRSHLQQENESGRGVIFACPSIQINMLETKQSKHNTKHNISHTCRAPTH